jgi:hypothetical protein
MFEVAFGHREYALRTPRENIIILPEMLWMRHRLRELFTHRDLSKTARDLGQLTL